MKMIKILMVLVIAAGLLGAGGEQPQPTPPVPQGKFSNFAILIDHSNEMNVNYKEQSKNFIAREVAGRMLNNIAKTGLPLNGAIYMYGIMAAENENRVLKVQRWKQFNLDEFKLALDKCEPQNGPSTLSQALRKLRSDITSEEKIGGWVAVFVLSAGNLSDIDDYEERAKELKQAYPNLCIYTIQIGPNEKGADNLDKVVKKGKCGWAVNADSLTTGLEVENYIRSIMLEQR
jgi:hypothetical protein